MNDTAFKKNVKDEKQGELDEINHIACGRYHVMFATSRGELYSCGSNDKG